MDNDLTPKQQASEAIRQARTILVATGAHPSVDQVAAVIALTSILRKFEKKVTAIISDAIPTSLTFLTGETLDRGLTGQRDFILKVDLKKAEVDSLKYTVEDGKLNIHITPSRGGFGPSDVTFAYGNFKYDLAIVVGVATRARIDRLFSENPQIVSEVPLINFDFHRTNENYGAINLIDPNAASLCEMLVALSESLATGMIDEPIATALLTGIIGSTDRFTATHTTPKSLTVAAQMMAAGAKQQLIVQNLYRSGGAKGDQRDTGRGPRRPDSDGGRPDNRSQTPEPSAPVATQETDVMPVPADVQRNSADVASATQEQSHQLTDDPSLYFQGSGSVLATPEASETETVNDPYQDPSVLAFNQDTQIPAGN